jgi:hypothetical protein
MTCIWIEYELSFVSYHVYLDPILVDLVSLEYCSKTECNI